MQIWRKKEEEKGERKSRRVQKEKKSRKRSSDLLPYIGWKCMARFEKKNLLSFSSPANLNPFRLLKNTVLNSHYASPKPNPLIIYRHNGNAFLAKMSHWANPNNCHTNRNRIIATKILKFRLPADKSGSDC